MVCHSLLQWTTFCQTSPPWPARLGWPHVAWLSFIKLDKAVVHVIRLTSFLWLWFQCVYPLMPSCNTYHLTWVSLTLDKGCLLTATPPDLERWVAPVGPPTLAQPSLLGHGVAPLGHTSAERSVAAGACETILAVAGGEWKSWLKAQHSRVHPWQIHVDVWQNQYNIVK